MPRFFLKEAGIKPETDFNGEPNYSGSHDKTYKLVESGSFPSRSIKRICMGIRSGREKSGYK